MKAAELRTKTELELSALLLETERERFNLKMQKATGQLSKPDQIRRTRRDVARINTILGQRGAKR